MPRKKEIDPYWQTFALLACLILLALYFSDAAPACKVTSFETPAKPR